MTKLESTMPEGAIARPPEHVAEPRARFPATQLGQRGGGDAGAPGRDPGRAPGRGRDRRPARRRDLALRLPPAARLVGRAGLDPVPVARHAGGRRGVPARRAHAHDGLRRHGLAAGAGVPRRGRDRRPARLPAADRPSGLRVRLRGDLHHHAGAGDPERLAGRRDPGRARC